MDGLVGPLVVIVLIAAAALGLRWIIRPVTVHEYERGLRFRRGRFVGLVNPGLHLAVRPIDELRLLDARPVWLIVDGQEIPTAGGVPVKVSVAARYVVGDAVTTVLGDRDHLAAFRLALQFAIRDEIAGLSVDEALAARGTLGALVADRIGPTATSLGLEVLEVRIRDIMLPGELKRAYAAVHVARKDGEASLERARGETASLRSLANAARLMDGNPALVRLRALQGLASTPGHTLVLDLGADDPEPARLDARRRPRPRLDASSPDPTPDG